MENASPVSVHAVEEFRLSDALVRFQGGDQVPLSLFVAEYPLGDGPPLHIHPYAELFLVERGAVKFTADGEEIEISAGSIVVVDAETKHRFEGTSDELSRVVSIHPSAEVVQENLS
jgi:quercetin dioxygenase-like cupin family protein